MVRYSPVSNRQMSIFSLISGDTSASITVIEIRSGGHLAAKLGSLVRIAVENEIDLLFHDREFTPGTCRRSNESATATIASHSTSTRPGTLIFRGFIRCHVEGRPEQAPRARLSVRGRPQRAASLFVGYLSNSANVHTDAPAGTFLRFGSPARSA